MTFKMKGWGGYVNSPVKQKDDEGSCYINDDGDFICPPKSDEQKKKDQEKINAQIEGTYEPTEEDIIKKKEDAAKDKISLKRPD